MHLRATGAARLAPKARGMSLLDEIVRIAHDAGDAILTVYRGADFGTTLKADRSPLTLADRHAHETIAGALARLTPEIPLLSEESEEVPYATRAAWTRFWLVDPLDGTKEFLNRNDEFTVNIALIERGRPVLGVVYAPRLAVTYAAQRGTARGGETVRAPPRFERGTIAWVVCASWRAGRTRARYCRICSNCSEIRPA